MGKAVVSAGHTQACSFLPALGANKAIRRVSGTLRSGRVAREQPGEGELDWTAGARDDGAGGVSLGGTSGKALKPTLREWTVHGEFHWLGHPRF